MMFTEGLDESAISWIKQGTDTPPAAARSPLAERLPLGQISADAAAPRSPALYNRACVGLFSPKSLPPPVRTATRHSGLLGRHSVLLAADSEEEEEGEESVASWGLTEDCGYGYFSDHTAEEDGVCSSDSSLFRRARDLYGNGVEDEVTSQFSRRGGGLARGQSKENLRVEVRAAAAAAFAGKSSRGQDQVDCTSHERYVDVQKFQDFGPPSAPPIAAIIRPLLDVQIADESAGFEKTEISSVADILAQDVHELPTRSTVQADGVQMPYIENNLLAQIPRFTTKIQKFLLHPKHKNQDDGKHTYDKDESCSMKARKLVKRIEIEEMFTCTLELKSSLKGQQRDSISLQYLKPGTGESQLFYLEGQGDTILVEVQDNNRVVIGHAEIQVSSFSDAHLCLNLSMPSDNYGSAKMLQGGLAVDTIIYDMVLEAAMRAQNFNSKMLHISGSWKWLLDEFSDYYGVSDAYRKLRYLCYIMNVATPTKDCLELTYELLLPVIKARDDRTLTRQERSILLDCEDRINVLLAIVFENYKSLDELSITGLSELFGPISDFAAPALAPAVQIFSVLHDILSNEAQSILRSYLQTAAAKRCRRHMIETDEFMSSNNDNLLTDDMTISAAYLKMKTLCINISLEIQADIKIHDQNILPSSIDLPNIAASLYSTELCKRLKGFLSASPPSRPLQHVAELLIATADFERDLDSWQVRPVHGGVLSRELFHDYIMVWIEDTRLHLLDYCKAEKAIADVEREVMKALEKQYMETLMPLRDGIPKILEKHVQRLTRRQSVAPYVVPNQLGTFMNTVKRMLDVLHCRVEDILKSWAAYLTIANGTTLFGEQMNSITVMLRKKYKKYLQAIVEKIVSETQANRTTRLKRILEETKETEGESEMRERMQALRAQLSDSIHNLHGVFSCRIFVAICRGFWDRLGQIVLRFLESRKENRIWYRGSDYALGILDDVFASEMQKLLGNALQDKDLDPPQSVIDARSILC
ncbi:unnamed protein product [Triticum turgidum subsp. durum]|uniref:Uncharacterized protein n=1 Tax=Triticum turgidum subsp. durum TaxID=4567 RepID=A0A9R0YL59_TRITD|nr:unnamed protein product [Triticum turgidum subsp. durum]